MAAGQIIVVLVLGLLTGWCVARHCWRRELAVAGQFFLHVQDRLAHAVIKSDYELREDIKKLLAIFDEMEKEES